VRLGAAPVGEGLTIVIILLLAEVQSCEGDNIIGRGVQVVDLTAGDLCGLEVFHYMRQCIGPVAPVGVVDGGIVVAIVATPL
jgi:hypothetical protein